jgi:Ca2+-binding RTX toxin-like protein
MATFDVTIPISFTVGTAAADTFYLGTGFFTVLGLDGDDTFRDVPSAGFGNDLTFLDGGNGNDSFTFDGITSNANVILGGDGNDTAFIASGSQNSVSGGAGNDWLGIGGGASYILSTSSTAATATTGSALRETTIRCPAAPATIMSRSPAVLIRSMAAPATTACSS